MHFLFKIIFFSLFTMITIFAKPLSNQEIYKIFFKNIRLDKSQNVFWIPPKNMKFLPKKIFNTKIEYRLKILYKFTSCDRQRVNVAFVANYLSCKNCNTYILTGSISLKNHKVIIPIQYLFKGGSFGEGIYKIYRGNLKKNVDLLVLDAPHEAQGFTSFNTYLIGFFKNKTKLLLNTYSNGQIRSCKAWRINNKLQIPKIVEKLMPSMRKEILSSYDNITRDRSGNFLSSINNYCQIFLKDSDKYPKLFIQHIFFKKDKFNHISKIYKKIQSYKLSNMSELIHTH